MLKRAILLSLASAAVAASAFAAGRPDLEVTWLTDPPSALARGASFDAAARVTNTGGSRARRSRTAFYLSKSPREAAGRLLMAKVPTRRLRAGSSTIRSVRVTVPHDLERGEYFLVVCPDVGRRVRESDERGNCAGSADYMAVGAPR